jgi:sterol desaturase/sphingolipid hydroxylase (fatty acid hydroxylase superfamily)
MLWKFHKVHHSVTEMGFAAHLRYHWMETFIYRIGLFVFMSWLLNFKLEYTFFLHAFTILIGHLNHANIALDYGPLKYILNNPKMHIWHHAKEIPQEHPNGMNFGITLSIWDYLFKTNYIPHDGRDIKLGFDGIEKYPKSFIDLQVEPFKE